MRRASKRFSGNDGGSVAGVQVSSPLSRHQQSLKYSGNAWSISEDGIEQSQLPQSESIFSVGNGFIGIRGCFEEGLNAEGHRSEPPVYLNGVYETTPIHYHEPAYGFPTQGDTRIPVPDATSFEIYVDDERVSTDSTQLMAYSRELDLRRGIVRRHITVRLASGRRLAVTFERVAFFHAPQLAAIHCRCTALNFSGKVRLVSSIEAVSLSVADEPLTKSEAFRDPRVGPRFHREPWVLQEIREEPMGQGFLQVTRNSRIVVASMMAHSFPDATPEIDETQRVGRRVSRSMTFVAQEAQVFAVTKFMAYDTDRGEANCRVGERCAGLLDRTITEGYAHHLAKHLAVLDQFWHAAEVSVPANPILERGVRLGMLQILQATGRDGKTSVCSKGQTGEGYEGHVFWDAEIFVLPMLVFTAPDIARSMLMYRYLGLDAARDFAKTMGHQRGALFPWRTISGTECSSYFPAGSAQYHISADIAYAVKQYCEATDDYEFLRDCGAEIVIETARLWMQVGFYNAAKKNQFCINEVTGPDEYTALVNNNLYTNAMARNNLEYAAEVIDRIGEKDNESLLHLINKLKLTATEVESWREAAARMYLPYDEQRRIYAQDDLFLAKACWDFAQTSKEKYPLLLHFHPLTIYRHQVCKQADAVLAMFLLKERFEPDIIKRTLAYYLGVTVHDSSLSESIHSIVASQVGDTDTAFALLSRSARIDLENTHGNSRHGLHMAAMGGSWMALAFGYAGLNIRTGELRFSPRYDNRLGPYTLRVSYRGRVVELTVNEQSAKYHLVGGEPLSLHHYDEPLSLALSQSDERELPL